MSADVGLAGGAYLLPNSITVENVAVAVGIASTSFRSQVISTSGVWAKV